MENIATAEQLEQLAAYMASQINVPTIGIGGGYAPIGTIISVMGTTAPQDYLACDGTVYNIADYPQLADYFESQFGESNHFGGNGTTTFAVPDLQGEFLRGTGTNSHTNQGSGANVGVHQDATEHKGIIGNNEGTLYAWGDDGFEIANVDSNRSHSNKKSGSLSSFESGVLNTTYTSRPTNTSVLYCIKAVVAGEVYSTEERVVGTWIDGKPIYKSVVDCGQIPAGKLNAYVMYTFSNNVDHLHIITAYTDDGTYVPYAHPQDPSFGVGISYGNSDKSIKLFTNLDRSSFGHLWIIVEYTKTTD